MTSQPVEPRRALYDEGGPGHHRAEWDRVATWYSFEPVYYRLYQKLKQNAILELVSFQLSANRPPAKAARNGASNTPAVNHAGDEDAARTHLTTDNRLEKDSS